MSVHRFLALSCGYGLDHVTYDSEKRLLVIDWLTEEHSETDDWSIGADYSGVLFPNGSRYTCHVINSGKK